MSITPDDLTPDFGQSVDITIAGHSEIPNAVLVNGVAETKSSGSTTFVSVTFPPGTDFAADGDHQYTALGADIPLTVQFPTESEETVQVQITPTTPYSLLTAPASPYADTSIWPTGTGEGDKMLVKVVSGTLDSLGNDGVVVSGSATALVLERNIFPVNLGMWTATDTLTFQTVNYPTLPQRRPQITPVGESVITRPTVTGALRTLDIGSADVFRIELVHPILEESQVQTLMDFWTNNRGADFTLVSGGFTYSCRLVNRPRQRPSSNAPLRSDVISTMSAIIV